ncbi:hypothetical protein IBX73_07605 [candidate division WOR-3 bacterium]|nr:hypothetical protein [candidate division WOR-3 bacterium]
MNRIHVRSLLLFLAVGVVSYLNCGSKKTGDNGTYPINKSDTVTVVLNEMNEAKIIVYATEPARILVGFAGLKKNLEDFIAQNNVADDILLNDALSALGSQGDTTDISESITETRLLERFQFRLADLLETGDAVVIDRRTGAPVGTILLERFESVLHKMAGRGGRRFYLPDRTLFLEIIDWLS